MQAENQFSIEKIFARTTVWLDRQPDDGVSLNPYIGRLTRLLCDWMQGACEGSFTDYEALIYLYTRIARYYRKCNPAFTAGLSHPYWRLFSVQLMFEEIDNTELIKQFYVATKDRPDWHLISGLVTNVNCPPELLGEIFSTFVDFDEYRDEFHLEHEEGSLTEQISFFVVNHIAANQSCPGDVLRLLASSPFAGIRFDVASNINTPPEALRILADDIVYSHGHSGRVEIDLPVVMWAVAGNISTPVDVLQNLANLDLGKLVSRRETENDYISGLRYSLDGLNGEHLKQKVSRRASRTLDRVNGLI